MNPLTKVGLWMLFALLQTIGIVIPQFTNIHSNIWPAFALLFLAPGIAIAAVLGLTWGIVLAVPINAMGWYFGLRWLGERFEGKRYEHASSPKGYASSQL